MEKARYVIWYVMVWYDGMFYGMLEGKRCWYGMMVRFAILYGINTIPGM